MKVCLINPPQVLNRRFGMPYVFQPLGLLYVASALEKNFQVEVIDASLEGWQDPLSIGDRYHLGISFEELEKRIRDISPDIVGISVPFSINEASALKTASTVKAVDRKIVTILGGTHPSVRPMETLSSDDVDFVVIGEGEEAICELVRILESGRREALKDVKGIGYKDAGSMVLTSPRDYIRALDSIPFPARNLVPMEEYFLAAGAERAARPLYNFDERTTSIITSRGCPYQCNFCSIHLSMGRQFRPRSPENVIAEIKQVIKDYGVRHLNFEDDNLTLDKKRAKRIFELMTENKLNVTWSAPNGIRADTIDEELVRAMKDSGCRRVFVAPESGVQRVVTDLIGKDLDLKRIEEAVILFKKYGIIVDGSFVIGFIGETKKEIRETIRYALRLKRLGMSAAGFHIATPYYGTRLYEEAVQKGFLRADFDSSLLTTGEPLISTPEWDLDTIKRLHTRANWIVNYSLREKALSILRRCRPVYAALKFMKTLYYWLTSFIPLIGNACRHLIMRASRKIPRPEYLVYEVTNACNSRCRHCHIWKNKPAENILTANEIERILGDDLFSDLKLVLLTGGEPVLQTDINEIISAIHKVKPKAAITLSTNGILPERVLGVMDYAMANNIKINIGVSLDAIGERHDLIRGVKGNFEKVDYLLKELVKRKKRYGHKMGEVIIGYTLSSLTVDTLKDVAAYTSNLQAAYLHLCLYEEFTYYRNQNNADAKDYQSSDNKELIKAIEELPVSFYNEMLLDCLKHRLKFRCEALRKFFLLRCDGSVAPCLKYCETAAGNVRSVPPSEIWYSKEAADARKAVKECGGCSNSWATSWSFEDWLFPFLKIRLRTDFKRFIAKIKRRG